MSEFAKLTTQLVTPIMKRRGFTKHGAFQRSSTHDSATYRNGDIEVRLIYAFHPYDYPNIGIRLVVRRSGALLLDSLHPPTTGGTQTVLGAAIDEIEAMLANPEPE